MKHAKSRIFHLVNVLTRDGVTLTGNPLCVFEDGTGLAADEMQALALQFNFRKGTGIDARVRVAGDVVYLGRGEILL